MMKPLIKENWDLFKKIAFEYSNKTDPNWNLPDQRTEVSIRLLIELYESSFETKLVR